MLLTVVKMQPWMRISLFKMVLILVHILVVQTPLLSLKQKVVNNSLGCGSNTLVNWAQAGVGDNVIQDYARVHLTNICPVDPEDPSTPVNPGTEDPNLPNELPTTGQKQSLVALSLLAQS